MKSICVWVDDRTAKAYKIWLIQNGLPRQRHLGDFIRATCGTAKSLVFVRIWGVDTLETFCERFEITAEEAERYEKILIPLEGEKGITIYKNYDGAIRKEDENDLFSYLENYFEADEIKSIRNACVRRGLLALQEGKEG